MKLALALSRDAAALGVLAQLWWVGHWGSRAWVLLCGLLMAELVASWQVRWLKKYSTAGTALRGLAVALVAAVLCHMARLSFSERSYVTWIATTTLVVVVFRVSRTKMPKWCTDLLLFLSILTSLNLSIQLDLLLK